MFKIKTVPQCPKRIRQIYQGDEELGIDVTRRFEVKTKDKTFSTSVYPFLQTDYLADQLIGNSKNQYYNLVGWARPSGQWSNRYVTFRFKRAIHSMKIHDF